MVNGNSESKETTNPMVNEYSESREFTRRYETLLSNIGEFAEEWLTSLLEAKKDDDILDIYYRLLPYICKVFSSDFAFMGVYPSDKSEMNTDKSKSMDIKMYSKDKDGEKYSEISVNSLDGVFKCIYDKDKNDKPFNSSDKDRIGNDLWSYGMRNVLADRISIPPNVFIIGVGRKKPADEQNAYMTEYDSYYEKTLEIVIEFLTMSIRSYANLLKENWLKSVRESNSRGAIHDSVLMLLLSHYQLIEMMKPEEKNLNKEHDDDMADYIDTTISLFYHPPTERHSTERRPQESIEKPTDVFPEPEDRYIVKLGRDHTNSLEIEIPDKCIQSQLALARAYLYIIDDNNDIIPFLTIENEPKNKIGYQKAFKALSNIALKKIDDSELIIYYSALRTIWLWIYLKSNKEINDKSNLAENVIRDISNVYSKIKNCTNELLWKSLEDRKDRKNHFPKIDSEWLSIWFGTRLLEDYEMNTFCKDLKNGTLEILRYYRSLAIYMLYQIHCLRYPDIAKRISFTDVKGSADSEVISSKTYLICQFAHISSGVDRQFCLYTHLQELFAPELILYTTSESYRDHLFHVVDVCLLGYLLLEYNKTSHWLTESIDCPRRKKLERNWFIASLLHDIGYRLKLSEKILDLLSNLESPELDEYKRILSKGISDAIDAFDKSAKDEKEKCNSIKDCEYEGRFAENHGAVSWSHVRNLLRNMKRDDKFMEDMAEALCAIFKHSSHVEICAEKEPISFLLLLCDRLQEWGHPRVEISELTRSVASAMHFSGVAKLDLRWSVTHLGINFNVSKNSSHKIEKVKDNLEFILNYVDSKGTIIEPAVIWAELSFDFKRIILPNKNKQISVTCIHPLKNDESQRWQPTEFELIQEFILNSPKNEGACLNGWLEAIKAGCKGISYKAPSKETNEEKFIVRLKELSSLDTLTQLPDKFYKTYSNWKKTFLGTGKT